MTQYEPTDAAKFRTISETPSGIVAKAVQLSNGVWMPSIRVSIHL